ncbi:MAG TPA: hypothetical protein PKD85_23270, partial [Saprospiraceae bacterium]|nr:hypothetical protein [Saprospiraceae bacterium]
MKKNILFLYSELAAYFLACVDQLQKSYDCRIMVVHWPRHKDAPFDYPHFENVEYIIKNSQSIPQLKIEIDNFNPNLIFVTGWIDLDYLKIIYTLKRISPVKVVMGLDNPWEGTLKQKLGIIILPMLLKRICDFIWVPGYNQFLYAKKLGFKDSNILLGLYSADVFSFHKVELNKKPEGTV